MHTLTIVGVGLIGGSIGLAAKNRRLFRRIRGVGRDQASLERARTRGAIDEAYLNIDDALPESDVVVFCTPVSHIAQQVLSATKRCSKETLLTDAGSTKGTIVREIEQNLPDGSWFVGSHPLAGSEKRGPEHADANLFANRWTVVTPTTRTREAAVERAVHFWQGLGSRVTLMGPEEHDDALALTSHLPHLLASMLAGILPKPISHLAATGFRDTTRIAAGDAALWTAIFQHNRPALLNALDAFQKQCDAYRQAMEKDDWATVETLLTQAKQVRDALGS